MAYPARTTLRLGAALFAFVCTTSIVCAQQPVRAGTAAAEVPSIPEPETLAALIRWTLLAVSQANLTGNYTVLRELGSPEFQNANTSAKLAMVFAGPREQKLDLTFVALATPQLSEQPRIDEKGTLRVVGYYPTRPLQVNFDLSFQAVAGTWRHSEIALAAGLPVLRMLPPRPLADAPQHPEQGKQPQGRVVPAGRK